MRPNPAVNSPRAMSILKWDVNAVAKMMAVQFPDTWRRMQVRSIDAPGNYFSSKIIQVGMTGAIEEARKSKQLDSNAAIAAGVLEKYDFPTYHVSAPLLEALKRSHPPANMAWADLTLPYQGLCFMVPRGSLVEPEPTHGEIACVGVVKLPAGEKVSIPTVGQVQGPSYNGVMVFWILGPSGLEINDATFPETQPLEPGNNWIDDHTPAERRYIGPSGDFTSSIAGLVANFILIMEARKELVEPGERLLSKTRKPTEVYRPTYIGRNYLTVQEARPLGEAQAHFTELGWRAGHFKRQHYGLKKEQTKTIFVDPYIAYVRGLKPVEKGEAV